MKNHLSPSPKLLLKAYIIVRICTKIGAEAPFSNTKIKALNTLEKKNVYYNNDLFNETYNIQYYLFK